MNVTELTFLNEEGLMWLISLELFGNYNLPSCLQTMKWTKKTIRKCIERILFLQGFLQRNVWGAQVWASKWPNKHKHLEHIFSSASMISGFPVPLIIMSLFKKVWTKCFHVSQQVALVTAELPPPPTVLSGYLPSGIIISEEERWQIYCKEKQLSWYFLPQVQYWSFCSCEQR